MSGHSKWATTKHRKGAKDSARAKVFAKLIRQVEVAAREGGGDLDTNASLRTMYQKAREASVPLDTIERAIKRGTGELEGVRYEADQLRGLRPRRRGGHRRDPDRQPQPHQRRDQARLRAKRRHHRRTRRGVVAVRPQGPHRGQGSARRGPVPRVGHGGRGRELRGQRHELHRHDRAPGPRIGARRARRLRRQGAQRRTDARPPELDSRRLRERSEEDPSPDGRDRRPRRRPERLFQLRHLRRDPRVPTRVKFPVPAVRCAV